MYVVYSISKSMILTGKKTAISNRITCSFEEKYWGCPYCFRSHAFKLLWGMYVISFFHFYNFRHCLSMSISLYESTNP